MTAVPASATAVPTRQRPWWMTLILGIGLFIIGAIMLWAPAKQAANTYLLLVTMLGVYWLIWGMMELVYMFVDHTAWGWKLFMGIVSILAGASILMYPVAAAVILPRTFVLILGIWALMEGIMLLFLAFRGGGLGAGLLGVISIVLGIVLMGDYLSIGSGLAMIWAGSVIALVGGAIMVIQAFRARSA
ncbi:MAG: DUF308 domain-containing protein [Anaerolineae bacterium]|nr:DUF308 domain-containing protein [Anaerolineae bacterium]